MALEAGAYDVRVNAVAPGPIDTGMLDRFAGGEDGKAYLAALNPQNRIGRPEEVARAVMFVTSDEPSFITGHILNVDGGKSAG